jgi:hypothetical protein
MNDGVYSSDLILNYKEKDGHMKLSLKNLSFLSFFTKN